MIFNIFSLLLVAPIYWFAEIQTDRARLKKGSREDNSMEASPVDIRENWSMDGSEERTAEERGISVCGGY